MKIKLVAGLALAAAAAGLCVSLPNAQATTTGSISGIVRANGAPLAGVFVTVIGIVDNGIYGRGPAPVGGGTTDADGHYTADGLAPSGTSGYWVCFETDDFAAYVAQCYDHVDGWEPFPSGAGFLDPAPGSNAVTLIQGQHRTGIDADLHQPLGSDGGIAGKVTKLGIVALRNVRVTAMRNGATAGATYTSGSGRYLITALTPGSYTVCFDSSHASGGLAGHGSAAVKCRAGAVAVNGGKVTSGINGTF